MKTIIIAVLISVAFAAQALTPAEKRAIIQQCTEQRTDNARQLKALCNSVDRSLREKCFERAVATVEAKYESCVAVGLAE